MYLHATATIMPSNARDKMKCSGSPKAYRKHQTRASHGQINKHDAHNTAMQQNTMHGMVLSMCGQLARQGQRSSGMSMSLRTQFIVAFILLMAVVPTKVLPMVVAAENLPEGVLSKVPNTLSSDGHLAVSDALEDAPAACQPDAKSQAAFGK